ncbi:ADP-ribosylglycohydrolase family protein [Deinococcus sonorensis]|uniref:ADP-ribosylglycohydrolase family protein n=2 Tax=Deinococcus sonorensis TaxID=309891 RepID=A0AAU7U7X0_9DEIO
MTDDLDRVRGLMYGLAYGDALAAPTEFIRDLPEIRRRFPPAGPTTLHQGRVTDDTQMALAVARALLATPQLTAGAAVEPLRQEFVTWLHDPDNNRAPGMTCLTACRRLEAGGPWTRASVTESKGCGANMRVQPAGVLPDADARAGYAQLQAALTHGHPTALAAAELTAEAIWLLLGGMAPAALTDALIAHARAQRTTYRAEWLGELWQVAGARSPETFIQFGWDECLAVLERLRAALDTPPAPDTDVCDLTGEGWIAEEALASGLLCFLLTPEEPLEALRRAAVTRGDSDSLGCLAGSFAGAHLGLGAFPPEWAQQIEYRDELAACADALTRRFA